MSARVTYLTMDYLDMCFQNNNWQFSSSKSQQVLLSRFHINLTCNTRNRKISGLAAGMSNPHTHTHTHKEESCLTGDVLGDG